MDIIKKSKDEQFRVRSQINKSYKNSDQKIDIDPNLIADQLNEKLENKLVDGDLYEKAFNDLDKIAKSLDFERIGEAGEYGYIEKAKKATPGEIREWKGKKYQKQASGEWKEMKDKKGGGKKKDDSGKKNDDSGKGKSGVVDKELLDTWNKNYKGKSEFVQYNFLVDHFNGNENKATKAMETLSSGSVEKAKKAGPGEIREWKDGRYQKQASGEWKKLDGSGGDSKKKQI